MNNPGAFTNCSTDEQSHCGNDIEQFGQLLATLLGHCHGSSEYIKVNGAVDIIFTIVLVLRPKEVDKNLVPRIFTSYCKLLRYDCL